jgi:hypothetical protein
VSDSPNLKPLKLAEFLRQALDLEDSVESLASEIAPFKQDVNAGISTIELDSSVGIAPFLIYYYELATVDASGKSGADLFEADLRTLERSAQIDSPGPRIMAHAVAGAEAYILATTPTTHRVLTGAEPPQEAGRPGVPIDSTSSLTLRDDAANRLLELLANANQVASTWLAALRSAEGDAAPDDFIQFTEAESALALFVLDDRSIRDLLTTLNLMVESARRLAPEPGEPERSTGQERSSGDSLT